jgi:hypothetical protein
VLCAIAPPASGQTYDHGDFEIAMMHGLGIMSIDDGSASVLMTPVPPVWRLSYWTPSVLQAEFGFSLLQTFEKGNDFRLLTLEAGIGANLAQRGSKTVPFVTGLGGLLNLSDSGDSATRFYFGGSAGIRLFFRDYAAARLQASLRNIIVDNDSVRIFEVVGGLSFFL